MFSDIWKSGNSKILKEIKTTYFYKVNQQIFLKQSVQILKYIREFENAFIKLIYITDEKLSIFKKFLSILKETFQIFPL